MTPQMTLSTVLNSVLYSFLGLAVFAFGFYVVDKLTPYQLWKELLEKHNTALAIVVGAISIGICIIIASAIHG